MHMDIGSNIRRSSTGVAICSICVVVTLFWSRSISQLNEETQTAHVGLKQRRASNIADDSTVCCFLYPFLSPVLKIERAQRRQP